MKRRRPRIEAQAMPHGDIVTNRHGPSVRIRLGDMVQGLSRSDAIALRQQLEKAEREFDHPKVERGPRAYEGRWPIVTLPSLAEEAAA